MRAVLDVGGYCAEGGPYVIAQHCPDGVALLLPLAIFAGLGCAGLMGWKGAALGGPYAGLVALAWPALFISLGWNFLQFALFPPPPDTGIELGWLIPGVLFVIMGAAPLVGYLPGGKNWRPKTSSETPLLDEVVKEDEGNRQTLKRQRSVLLADMVKEADQRAGAQDTSADSSAAANQTDAADAHPPEDADLVGKLERLSALYRAGSLNYDEFHKAKQASNTSGQA